MVNFGSKLSQKWFSGKNDSGEKLSVSDIKWPFQIIVFLKHSLWVHLWIHLLWIHTCWILVWLVWVLWLIWIIHPWPLSGWPSLLKQNSHFLFVTCIFWSYHANPKLGLWTHVNCLLWLRLWLWYDHVVIRMVILLPTWFHFNHYLTSGSSWWSSRPKTGLDRMGPYRSTDLNWISKIILILVWSCYIRGRCGGVDLRWPLLTLTLLIRIRHVSLIHLSSWLGHRNLSSLHCQHLLMLRIATSYSRSQYRFRINWLSNRVESPRWRYPIWSLRVQNKYLRVVCQLKIKNNSNP